MDAYEFTSRLFPLIFFLSFSFSPPLPSSSFHRVDICLLIRMLIVDTKEYKGRC